MFASSFTADLPIQQEFHWNTHDSSLNIGWKVTMTLAYTDEGFCLNLIDHEFSKDWSTFFLGFSLSLKFRHAFFKLTCDLFFWCAKCVLSLEVAPWWIESLEFTTILYFQSSWKLHFNREGFGQILHQILLLWKFLFARVVSK